MFLDGFLLVFSFKYSEIQGLTWQHIMQDRNSSAGDCLEEVDINDVFNAIALSEESLVKSSYEEGYKIGQAQDNLEAFHLGYHRGAEIGAEIGFYSYFINNLTSDQTEKVSKILEPLNSLLESFPRGNDSSRDILKEIENIRSQFKRVCSILKVKTPFPKSDDLSF